MSEAGPSQSSWNPGNEEAWQVSSQAASGDPKLKAFQDVGYSVSGAMLWETTIGSTLSPQLFHLMHTPAGSESTILLALDSDESLKAARRVLPFHLGKDYYWASTRMEPDVIKELLIKVMHSVEAGHTYLIGSIHSVKGKTPALEPDNQTIQYEIKLANSAEGFKFPFAWKSKSSSFSGTLDQVSREICMKIQSSMEESLLKAMVTKLSTKRGFDLYRLDHNCERQLHLQCRVKELNEGLYKQVEAHLKRLKTANDAKEAPDGSGIELTSIKVDYGDVFGPVETHPEGHADLH